MTTETPGLEETNLRSKHVQKTPWRVDLAKMKERVSTVEYINPESIPHATVAIVILDNPFRGGLLPPIPRTSMQNWASSTPMRTRYGRCGLLKPTSCGMQ